MKLKRIFFQGKRQKGFKKNRGDQERVKGELSGKPDNKNRNVLRLVTLE